MGFNKKPSKNWKLRGWNCVGWGKIKQVPLISRIKLTAIMKLTPPVILRMMHPRIRTPPTPTNTTHAISKIGQKSQNRISRELDQKFGFPRITEFSSTFFEIKKSLTKKSCSYSWMAIRNSLFLPISLPSSLLSPTVDGPQEIVSGLQQMTYFWNLPFWRIESIWVVNLRSEVARPGSTKPEK